MYMTECVKKVSLVSRSPEDTVQIGRHLGTLLRPGSVVALYGDLGAGKTVLVKGIADGLGLKATIHSPTFTLIHEHPGPVPLYHVDLYRIDEADVDSLGLDEYLESEGVVVIEWAEKIKALLPTDRLDIELRFVDESSREIIVSTSSNSSFPIMEEISRSAYARS
jgi:tRNA threonylcarbamoyladenosine biosynthesis protein TsaE